MAVRRRVFLSAGLAILLLVSLQILVALAQQPGDPWLLRLLCSDEATFKRLIATGMRVLLWWDGQAYVLADAGQRAALASEGPGPEVLDGRPSQGDYHVVWVFPAEAMALRERYGTLVALGEGFYLLGLPRGVQLPYDAPRYAQHLPFSMSAPRPASQALLNPPSPPAALGDVVASVSEARLTQDVAALQDDDEQPGADALRSRYTLVPGLDLEAAYIARELAAAGLVVSYFPFTCGRTVNNVIGVLPGLRPESEGFFIVCAHYDSTAAGSAGWADGWPTMPAPGADDNASGTAGVLEAARALAGQRLAYAVRFCLFAGEEHGVRGSQAYAEALSAAGANVLGVINLDMIAHDSNQDGVMEVHVRNTSASRALGEVLVRNMRRYAPSLQPVVVATYAIEASDHAPFWSRGYPALLAIEDWGQDFNSNYHKVSDTLGVLNMPYCTNIVRAVVATIGELAQLRAPDLSQSRQEAAYDSWLGGSVAYTITLRNSGSVTARATLTDVLPAELALQGPITTGQGVATWDEGAHRLGWSGDLAPQAAVTLTYRVLLAPWLRGGLLIRNTALVDDGTGRVHALPTEARVAWRLILPLKWRGP